MSEAIRVDLPVKEGEILLIFTDKARLRETLDGLGMGSVLKKESGEPYFSDSPCKLSVSHKGDKAVAALSTVAVGVDMENVTVPRNVERLSRLFGSNEKASSLYDFYKIWTSKEAWGKCRGTGITYELLSEESGKVRHLDFGDYLVAVAGEGEIIVKEC